MPKAPKDPPQRESEKVLDLSNKQDIGSLGYWSVSSHKPGYGVENLADPSLETTWQSEGPQPHLINVVFPRRVSVMLVSLYTDVIRDDSYTPHKISIRCGTNLGDLNECVVAELNKPKGWQHFSLVHGQLGMSDSPAGMMDDKEKEKDVARISILQIAVLSNHLNGKDTHIRSIRIFSPLPSPSSSSTSLTTSLSPNPPAFSALPFPVPSTRVGGYGGVEGGKMYLPLPMSMGGALLEKTQDMFERRDILRSAYEERKGDIEKLSGRSLSEEDLGFDDESLVREFVREMPLWTKSLREGRGGSIR
ncbi:APC10-domain-containing protein [Atractiella rhizophila]|nr:APC10-domain-containing protein [Atractiella rhizophila]